MTQGHDHPHGDHLHHDHSHAHGEGHHSHHHGFGHAHVHAPAAFGPAFAIGITLNSAYVAAEAVYGVAAHSMALLADAGHNLGDVLALIAAWLAAHLARRAPSQRYTYGFKSSSILAALTNAVVLLLVTGGVAWESIQRLMHPQTAAGPTIILVALAGVLVNGVTALMFASGRKGDLNIRAAFAHMASDALVALGVAAAGLVILISGWSWLDPVISLAISLLIIVGTWSLMRESLDLAMQAVPASVSHADVRAYLADVPGVQEVHDLHIWGMSTTETALTAHLVRPNGALAPDTLRQLRIDLRERFSVHHATLQVEADGCGTPCHVDLAAEELRPIPKS